jgi:7-cyano-7-deazaguanine reductase
MDTTNRSLPLGQATDYPTSYAPGVLFPIARHEGRSAIGMSASTALPFYGADIWTNYEVSWLDKQGKPCVAVAEITVPASSPNLIESKSLKLYFNSLNFQRFATESDFLRCVEDDLSAIAGAAIQVRLVLPHDYLQLPVSEFPGVCLDDLPLHCDEFILNAETLNVEVSSANVNETLYSHLLRSNCPVTNQPDWGSVMIHYQGPAINRLGLLAYIVSYRHHADFHEQCVERIFMDIMRRCRPEVLTVYARYTRRGGLDINPFRSTLDELPASVRLFRQ